MPRPPKPPPLPAITIPPFDQAALYGWLECTIIRAASDFLRSQQSILNIDLLKKEVKRWGEQKIKLPTGESRKRDRVIEFMFGMEVQCRLIEGNLRYLQFSGPSSMNPAPVIAAWKNLIPSFSPKTYCLPDYLILEHLRSMERVLKLLGPAYYDSVLFERKRSEAVRTIMRSGEVERERLEQEKVELLREEREKAEQDLLREVGIFSSGGVV